MNCQQVSELVSLAAVGALENGERASVERHLSGCAACMALAAERDDLVSLLPMALEPAPPPARLRRSLMARVYSEAAGRPTRAWWRRAIDAIPASRGLTAAGALGVAVAIALATWIAVGQRPETAVDVAVTGTASELVTGNVVAQGPSADAVLTVHGLNPPRATSSVYEVWLIPAGGAPRGVAFLSASPGGDTWTAVIPGGIAGYQTIAATVEPAGGSPGPTGAVVLSGQLDAS